MWLSAQGFCRRIICNFGDYTFYAGQSNELDEGLAMCFYKVRERRRHYSTCSMAMCAPVLG